ncbi:uncharacterized protein LOC118460180 [Anopheles albimanus]|uniref:uncharacterized protein LOC118460180 n=1 Tax=Anopheles albimanus TaxID=7167 RepID=UPI00163E3851|nr:uncharacterized protein LOC118460180 [Anopheles albimanus]
MKIITHKLCVSGLFSNFAELSSLLTNSTRSCYRLNKQPLEGKYKIAVTMASSISRLDTTENVAQNVLETLHAKAVEIKHTVTEDARLRQEALTDLLTVVHKLNDLAMMESALKAKQMAISARDGGAKKSNTTSQKPKSHGQMLQDLEQFLGLTIRCMPERRMFEIQFSDTENTRLSFKVNRKGLELNDMYPRPGNIEAIRTHLHDTKDLIGLLAVLRRRLTIVND